MKIILITEEELRGIVRDELTQLKDSQEFHPNKKFNTKEAAEYLSIPVPTFRQHQHRIGGAKIGKHWFFTQSELDSYFQLNRRITSNKHYN